MTHRHRRARASRSRGFTLLELGIVIGVAAILAAAIVPDVIETMRNRMAEKAAADVAVIHDAARLYYVQNTTCPGCWPGEQTAGQCLNNFNEGNAIFQLLNGGYLTGGGGPATPLLVSSNFRQNPWGQAYNFTVYAPVTVVANPACLFGVATDVPQVISDAFISFLPQAACNLPGGPAPCPASPTGVVPLPGNVRCCSYVPKPGIAVAGPCPPGLTVRVGVGGVLTCAP